MRISGIRLKAKISLVNALSKVLIILIAAFAIPGLVNRMSIREIDSQLIGNLDKIYTLVEENGVDRFILDSTDQQAFGSYNILKEEYISMEKISDTALYEVIDYSKRAIEGEVLDYRVISATIESQGSYYLIEIGKSLATITDFQHQVRKFTFLFLFVLLAVTTLLDLTVTQFLLRPFDRIIARLKRSDHPKNFDFTPDRTTTTDFKYLEESIHGLMRKTQQAFNEERDYISNISHELLTPISIIRTKLDNFAGSTSLTDEEMVKIIEARVVLGRLTKMVRTLLLLSRIDNEEYILAEPVDMNQLLSGLGVDFQEHFEQKGLHFSLVVPDHPVTVQGNRELLHILFFNLVNNAVKYTPDGGRISVSLSEAGGKPVAEISDSGVGIPEEHLPFIFERFRKFRESGSNFGLGLALVKRIADYHHFGIDVFSKPGEGTKFVITIPGGV